MWAPGPLLSKAAQSVRALSLPNQWVTVCGGRLGLVRRLSSEQEKTSQLFRCGRHRTSRCAPASAQVRPQVQPTAEWGTGLGSVCRVSTGLVWDVCDPDGRGAGCVFRENSFMRTCHVGHWAGLRVWGVCGVVSGCVMWTQVPKAFGAWVSGVIRE